MKTYLSLPFLYVSLFAFHFSLFFSSCATDAYDKGEGEYSLMQAEMAEVHVDGDLQVDYFVTDDGGRYAVDAPYKSKWMTTPDSTYRAVAYFCKLGIGLADVRGFNQVGVIAPKKRKELKTDPVRFESAWMSRGGAYLNAGIYLLLGATDDDKAIQTIGCQLDTLLRNDDGTKTLWLTLYHDQGNVPEYYSQRAYVSIPLSGTDADSVSLTVNTYDGTVRKIFRIDENR